MEPTYRKPLNTKQLKVLYALYKFRFANEEQLTKYQGDVSRRYMHERVRVLVEQNYIGRRFDDSYRLAGKPAIYYLLPKGIDVLKQHPKDFNARVLRNIRRDINSNERFARHSINVFAIYCQFKEKYGDNFRFFTRSYLSSAKFSYFPKPLPDAYVSITGSQDKGTQPRQLIVECFDDTLPQSAMKQRIEDLINHADSGEWTDKAPYPEILLVCDTETLQKKAQRWSIKALEEGWTNELVITVKTKDRAV